MKEDSKHDLETGYWKYLLVVARFLGTFTFILSKWKSCYNLNISHNDQKEFQLI